MEGRNRDSISFLKDGIPTFHKLISLSLSTIRLLARIDLNRHFTNHRMNE